MANQFSTITIRFFSLCFLALFAAVTAAQIDTLPFRVSPAPLPNEGVTFVNHEINARSGHGGQTMTQCKNGDIIAFYSNVDGDIQRGHNTGGWSEYKISSDGGQTWSAPYVFPYSKKVWDERGTNKIVSLLIWEVATAPDGTVVAFGRRADSAVKWGGDAPPLYFLSRDNGRTWSQPQQITSQPGAGISREEAALVKGKEILVLYHDFYAKDRTFKLYASADNGKTFQRRSELPLPREQWYGTMGILPNGDLIVYTYNDRNDGRILNYITSSDNGKTWSRIDSTSLAKHIRKPRMSAPINGYYFMTGRSGNAGADAYNLVIYYSRDGISWDEGTFLNKGGKDVDSYSANLVVKPKDQTASPILLVQASVSYDKANAGRVNLKHWYLTVNPQLVASNNNGKDENMQQWFQEKHWLQGWSKQPDESINVSAFYSSYVQLPERWNQAFTYLSSTDLVSLAPGTIELDGTDLFVKVEEYDTKEERNTMYETHQMYADIQVLVRGSEKIGVAPQHALQPFIGYDNQKDIAFYNSAKDEYRVATPDNFFIFLPGDGHRPCVKHSGSSSVKKVVIKVRVG